MTWTVGLPMGLFRGLRIFTASAEGSGTRFTLRGEFSGPLLGLVRRTMPDLGPSFVRCTDGVRARAEGSTTGHPS